MRAARARSSAQAALSRAADARTAASSDSGSNRFRASSESAIACNWATWSGVQPSESRNPRIVVIGLAGGGVGGAGRGGGGGGGGGGGAGPAPVAGLRSAGSDPGRPQGGPATQPGRGR